MLNAKVERSLGCVDKQLNYGTMKKSIFLLLLYPILAAAQNDEVIDIASGEILNEKVSSNVQYVFPEFLAGQVHFADGKRSANLLNYNVLLGEMHFIDNEDVLAFPDLTNVLVVVVNKRRFFPFNKTEFCEEVFATDDTRLCVRRKGRAMEKSKTGAYGMETSASSVKSYNSIGSTGRQFNLGVTGKVKVSVENSYYFMNKGYKYVQIKNEKSIIKQFPGHNEKIETFVKEHKINFKDEDDLKELIAYCIDL